MQYYCTSNTTVRVYHLNLTTRQALASSTHVPDHIYTSQWGDGGVGGGLCSATGMVRKLLDYRNSKHHVMIGGKKDKTYSDGGRVVCVSE